MKRSARAAVTTMCGLLSAGMVAAGTTAAASSSARHSAIFAGYEVSKPRAHIKDVTATFVVPEITCAHRNGGVGPSVLVYSNVNQRTGTHRTSGGGIGVACDDDGNAFYQSVVIVNDKTIEDGVISFAPGDVVVIEVRVSRARTAVTLEDTTAGTSVSDTGAGKVASETFVGDNSINVDGVSGELNPFTKIHVTNVRIDGHPLGSRHPHRYFWVRDKSTLVTASALRQEENFTLKFRDSG